jgi:hypothetical protein
MDGRRLTEELNRRFGTEMSYSAVKCLRYRNGFKDRMPRVVTESRVFPPEVRAYMAEHVKGTGPSAMAAQLNMLFGTSYTSGQIKSYYGNHGLDSGVNGRFEKGHVPANKGMKMPPEIYARSKPTMFRKGHSPSNTAPVGTEAVTPDGYVKVKVAEPNRWEFKHRLEWMRHRGEIPEGGVVGFKDGDSTNTDIDNLMLLTRAEHLTMTRRGYRSDNPALTEAGVGIVKLESRCRELRKEKNDGSKMHKNERRYLL